MDSDLPTNNQQKNPGPWSCIPSRSGLFVHNAHERGHFLPASRCDGETVLRQPPLAETLSSDELNDLMRVERPYATTRYGPEVQEKASNQDFALSALIEDGGGGQWCFGAVADGVSTATFWPERAARLACLVSYRFFRKAFADRSKVDLGKRALVDLQRGLVNELRNSLKTDQQCLRKHQQQVPPTFTRQEYWRRWDSDELWYKTTLLVGLMGPEHGFVLWSGDGEIWLRRQGGTGSSVKRVIGSADGPLERYIWLGVQEGDLSVGKIPLDEQETATLALASDGLDRTLQLAETRYEELLPAGAAGSRWQHLEECLDKLYRAGGLPSGMQPEPDNASLVVLEWARGRRFGNEFKPPEEFALAEVLAPPAADPPKPTTPSPTETAQPPEPHHPPVATSPPQKPRPGTESSPQSPQSPQEHDAARYSSRTLPVPTIGVVCLVVLTGLGIYHFGGVADEPPEEALPPPPGPEVPAAAAPAESLAESSVAPPVSAQEAAQASTPAPGPTRPLDFVVLENNGPLLAALGSSKRPAEALVRELADWSWQARALSEIKESPTVTVVAYGDRDKPTLGGCLANEKVARDRAQLFAMLLKLFVAEVTVHAEWNVCEAPPGISDPASAEARRLVLFPGHQMFHCDCNDISWAK